MTSIDTSRSHLSNSNESKAKEVSAEEAWLQLRDLISPRRQLRLPVEEN